MSLFISFFFFFNDTATTEIYTLSLHDALPISAAARDRVRGRWLELDRHVHAVRRRSWSGAGRRRGRSEEHTSELQSRSDLVCRLLLEKKKTEIYAALIYALHCLLHIERPEDSL